MNLAEIDDEKVILNLDNITKAISSGMGKKLLDVGLEILRLSQEQVPHDKGTLQNSGTVEESNGEVIVGYHTPYAARLHEHPEFRFQKGRKGKYLEDPIIENEEALGIKLGKNIQISLGEAIK